MLYAVIDNIESTKKRNDFSIIPPDLVTQLGFELSLYPSENQYLLKHLNQ
jgi:hypothetical protein